MSEILKVADQVAELSRRMRRLTSERLDIPGLTPGRVRALRLLDHGGPMRMGELADLLSVSPRSVTDFVDDLVGVGLVQRVPDPADRRATLIASTDKGQHLLGKAERTRGAVAEEILSELSDQQVEQLSSLLEQALEKG